MPLKGQVLTQIARFWFDRTRDICPNHVIEYPDPCVLVCRGLKIMPVEIVVRDYLAGTTSTSILSMYNGGRREMYGHSFPDGMRPNQKLPQPIITPTTKAFDAGHDEELTPDQIIAKGLLSADQWDHVSRLALALFARGQEIAAKHGLILVDTKYEFGFDADGNIVLAAEIHTPDSSRYWFAESYPARFAAGEKPRASTRISCAAGSSPAAIPMSTTSRRFPTRSIWKRRGSISASMRPSPARNSRCRPPTSRCWNGSARTCSASSSKRAPAASPLRPLPRLTQNSLVYKYVPLL